MLPYIRRAPELGTSFGRLLRSYRQAAGLSQEELAERAGISTKAVGALERGERRRPYPPTVRALTHALALSDQALQALLASLGKGTVAALDTVPDATGCGVAVPQPTTALLGRVAELAEIADLLSRPDVRILTITGPAGVGKTRLALEVAGLYAPRFPGGRWFIPLSSLSDPSLVLGTIGRVLGVQPDPDSGTGVALQRFLANRDSLVVLDNFEHLMAAAPAVIALLESCHRLTLLVTSRESLHIRGERQVRLSPLAAMPALQLFEERAIAVSDRFDMDERSAVTVAAICRRLDWLPLAIELAASWVAVLSPAQILGRLQPALSILHSGPRDLPERQRTMRSAVDWSYSLLGDHDRAVFRRLGVFAGGWRLADAAAVSDGHDLLEALRSLVGKSLVVESGPERFTMLGIIREFALEQLSASGEEAATRDAHAAHYLKLLQDSLWDRTGCDESAALRRLDDERGNLGAALSWLETIGNGEALAGAGWILRWYWGARGDVVEGRRRLEAALDHDLSTVSRGRAELALAHLELIAGDYDRSRELAAAAVVRGQAVGDAHLTAYAWAALGSVLLKMGRLADAEAAFVCGRSLFTGTGQPESGRPRTLRIGRGRPGAA